MCTPNSSNKYTTYQKVNVYTTVCPCITCTENDDMFKPHYKNTIIRLLYNIKNLITGWFNN